jgi:membrane protein YdbS with pleckstrin-like domain
MNEAKVFIERPRTSSMIVYHAIWFFMIAGFAISSLFLYATNSSLIAIDYRLPWAGIFVGLGLAAMFGYWHLLLRSTHYTITETDVCARSGLLMKNLKTVRLSSIKTIEVQQEPVQRLFRLGDVILYTTGHTTLILNDLDHPEAAKETIWKLVQQQSKRRGSYFRGER